jgi:1-acyl-sn-glycerol-3-phosphate acyltransferase
MAKQELFKHPLANWYFSVTGTIPVNRTQLEKFGSEVVKQGLFGGKIYFTRTYIHTHNYAFYDNKLFSLRKVNF